MPTILRFAGLRVVIYTNDHRPAHVHVIGDGCEAVFEMNCEGGPITLRENYGFALARLRKIKIRFAAAQERYLFGMGANPWHCLKSLEQRTAVLSGG